jgi:hypothetical protein
VPVLGADAPLLTLGLSLLLVVIGVLLVVHEATACAGENLPPNVLCPAVMVQPYRAEGVVAVLGGSVLAPWGWRGRGDDGAPGS